MCFCQPLKECFSITEILFFNSLIFPGCTGSFCCTWACSSCGAQAPPSLPWLLAVEHRLGRVRRLSSCGAWAQLLWDMWNLPRQGIKPVSPDWQVDSWPLDHQGRPGHFFSWNLHFFFLFLYRSIVDLQCCASFRHIAEWFSHTHMYIYFLSDSFFLIGY